ncbi:MAG TPA: hypothetical protein VE445_04775 [Nitrososphaeraceae archaeon]|nr:hypothetical protein [Nitrososphaeraceae archaeon]
MMARVSVPFTEGHYSGRGERPNTGLAHNSPSVCRKKSLCSSMIWLKQEEEVSSKAYELFSTF